MHREDGLACSPPRMAADQTGDESDAQGGPHSAHGRGAQGGGQGGSRARLVPNHCGYGREGVQVGDLPA